MENIINNLVTSNVTAIKKEILNEACVAKEIEKVVELDIKELDLYEAKVSKLANDVHGTKDLENLQKIEDQFIEIKNDLLELIKRYINLGIENILELPSDKKIYKTVGDYIDDKRNDFLVSLLTHRAEEIPEIILKIIRLEEVKNDLEMNINHRRVKITEPAKTYEVSKSFEVQMTIEIEKVAKDKEIVDKYVNDTLTYVAEDQTMTDAEKEIFLLEKIDYILKKDCELLGMDNTKNIVPFMNATLNRENIISLSITSLRTNNLLRAAWQLSSLEFDNPNYINKETYRIKALNHQDDYIMFEAINENSLDLITDTKSIIVNQIVANESNKDNIKNVMRKMNMIEEVLRKKDYEVKQVNDIIIKQRSISKIIK